MSYFICEGDFNLQSVPQGLNEWINHPEPHGEMPGLFAARASIAPGMGHDFHLHPGREEIIYVLRGTIEQWVGKQCRTLTVGDVALIPASCVHASFNVGSDKAVLFVVLTPAKSDEPLAHDVSSIAPWNALRRAN